MAEVIHPPEVTFPGPWLFDKAVMDALEAVVKEQWDQLQINKKRLIDNTVKREKYQAGKEGKYNGLTYEQAKELDRTLRKEVENDPTYSDDGVVFILTLGSRKKVKATTLAEAAGQEECQAQHVTKLEVSLVCGGVKVSITVPSTDKKNDLQIVSLPEGSEAAREALVKLSIWAENHRPDWIRRLNGLPPPLIFSIFAVLLVLLVVVVSITAPLRRTLSDEARELVDKGITPADHSKALTILLRRGYEPEISERPLNELPYWLWLALAIMTIPTILFCITATTAFEIGHGRTSVAWQKWHGTLLRRWMPGFIVMGVLASIVGAVIYDKMR